MAANPDDIWILGITMTKFGKHTDRDVVDLAAEAVTVALDDAGVTMSDIGVIGAGNLLGGGGVGQLVQKQVGQTGVPVYNVATRYEQAGVGPEDLDLVELHDCFATAELVHYDNLGLCEPGGAADFFNSGAPWRDGATPVNVSGGLQSKGHPISATGIANIWEICHHLRGEAGDRQIEGAKVGLAHVIGLGSACGVHILEAAA